VHLFGQVTQVTAPFLGWIADRYGAPTLAYIMAATCWLGLGLLITATSVSGMDKLLYVAFVCLGLTTWMGGLLIVQAGLYWTGQTQSRVIFVLNSLFDAGSVTYLALWGVAVWTGASAAVVTTGYTVLAVFVFGGSIYFWSVAVPEQDENDTQDTFAKLSAMNIPVASEDDTTIGKEAGCQTDTQTPESNETNKLDLAKDTHDTGQEASTKEADSTMMATRDAETNDDSPGVNLDTNDEDNAQDKLALTEADSVEDNTISGDIPKDKEYVIVAERSSWQQIKAAPSLLLVTFFAIHTTANQWNLTTQRDFLAYLGDDEQDNKYLTIFTLLMPASIVALPFVDAAISKYGFVGGLQSINLLALGYNVVKVSSDNLNVQIFGFILFSFFRCFLYSVSLSMLPTFLGNKVVGKATGLMFSISGLTAFLNIPLKNLAVKELDGDFLIPNLVYTALVFPCVIAAWGLGKTIKRNDTAKAAKLQKRLKSVTSTLVEEDTA
jgi:MFS family permease